MSLLTLTGALVLGLTACGIKGPLYLPKDKNGKVEQPASN
ncbi:lipoprotein [Leeia sp. TBRC 13508]|uniref:Lipoprotein n=1 Tax=Leeia speluncae TaxID=2884804 RepID=A0ABS8D7Y4_9NEIS|nr:lipoprotein [Leeia speluncae]MCB6184091.1 lipoprotein [Leeia speluncae]